MPYELAAVSDLSAVMVDRMRGLMEGYYLGVDAGMFAADLANKQRVLLLRNGEGGLTGFSTLRRELLTLGERNLLVTFSGDTIVELDRRQSVSLPVGIAKALLGIGAEHPALPHLHLLICKGWRTYRLMAALVNDCTPSRVPTSDAVLICAVDEYARRTFGDHYDPARGVIVAGPGSMRIRPGSAEDLPASGRSADADFFAARNPGYLRGDELVGGFWVRPENIRAALLRRCFRAGEACC